MGILYKYSYKRPPCVPQRVQVKEIQLKQLISERHHYCSVLHVCELYVGGFSHLVLCEIHTDEVTVVLTAL